jgi:hypothetical protein
MNPAVTCRVSGRCAGSAIIGDDSRVIDVEGKIVDSRATVRPSSVGRIIAGRRVLKNCTRPLDTVNFNKDSLLLSEIIGDGTGRTWRMPTRWSWPRGQPSLRDTPTNGRSDPGTERASIERGCPSLICGDICNSHTRGCTAHIRIPRANERSLRCRWRCEDG